MGYAPDPGGVFASDTHRRVLGYLPQPDDPPIQLADTSLLPLRELTRVSLAHRISADPYHGLQHVDELAAVLADLEDDGYAAESKGGWRQTKKGLEALNAPVPDEVVAALSGPALLGGLEA